MQSSRVTVCLSPFTYLHLSTIQSIKKTYTHNRSCDSSPSCPGGGLGITTDRDQRSWVFLNNPKNTLPLKENPKKAFRKVKH